ncbi:MAG: hypothetical protein PVF96_01195 [Candidatus Bathyarchaeota archaeon]|jgi:hypothetical protein
MPQRVTCQKCGCVLYEDNELKTPEEILHKHDGKCPECGRKLALMPLDIEVKPAEEL